MSRFLVRRVLLTLPVLLGVATLVFSLIHLIPGDPAQAMLGEAASQKDVEELRRKLEANARSYRGFYRSLQPAKVRGGVA